MNEYQQAADVLVRESGVTVKTTFRQNLTGTAWTHSDDWAISVPRPTSPLRFAVFAHEVAHQLLHRTGSRPRWQEEIEAWDWSLDQFTRFDFDPTAARVMAERGIKYAIGKALRRSKDFRKLSDRMIVTCPQWEAAVRTQVAKHILGGT